MLYLASQSPQRATLLTQASVAFTVVASTCREDDINDPLPQALAIARARAKARGAQGVPAGGVVLGADTVVALGREILGSPADAAGVAMMLGKLGGTTHQVLTAHCLWRAGTDTEAVALSMARVTMRPLSAQEIADYAASGEGVGKAGGYAIQLKADRFVVDVAGAIETVIGLHVPTVAKLWREVAEGGLPVHGGSSGSGLQKALK